MKYHIYDTYPNRVYIIHDKSVIHKIYKSPFISYKKGVIKFLLKLGLINEFVINNHKNYSTLKLL